MSAIPPRTTSAPHGKTMNKTMHADPGGAQKVGAWRPGGAGAAAPAWRPGGNLGDRSSEPKKAETPEPAPQDDEEKKEENTSTQASPVPEEAASREKSGAVSPSQEDAAPLPPPTSMIEDGEYDEEGLMDEEALIYSTAFFGSIRNYESCSDCVNDVIRKFAAEVWEKVPDMEKSARNVRQPDSAWSREGIFSEKAPSRPKERTLHNQILGILTRLTPENYQVMERELLDLPIRQSTKEQIEDVVKTIYLKAIRPEDAPYVELYMKLVVALVNHCGTTSGGVGKVICRAIVENCQQQFEGSKFVLRPEDTVDAEGRPLEREEIEYKKKMLKDKLKANITFLGHLYISHLVQEKVVNLVLYQLMYGDQSRPRRGRHKPEDYEVEMFCELFRKVGPHLTAKTLDGDHWPTYIDSMKTLSSTTSAFRIKFMLIDALDFYQAGWKSKKSKAGPMTLDEQQRKAAEDKVKQNAEIEAALRDKQMGRGYRRGGGDNQATSSPKIPEQVRLPEKEEVIKVLADFVEEPSDEAYQKLTGFLSKLPTQNDRKNFFGFWVERALKTARCNPERAVLPELLLRLASPSGRVFGNRDINDIIETRLRTFAEDGLIEDNPRLVSSWVSVIQKAEGEQGGPHPHLGMDMHSAFLKHLVQTGRPTSEITEFIATVWKDSGSKVFQITQGSGKRFRLLPYILNYEQDEEELDLPLDEQSPDLVDEIQANFQDEEASVEVRVFYMLCEAHGVQEIAHFINRHPQRTELGLAAAVTSAAFTFVRFDVSRLDQLRDVFSALVKYHRHSSSELSSAILYELYATYHDLEQIPEKSLGQVAQWLVTSRFIQQKHLDEFKSHMTPEIQRRLDGRD